MGGSKGKTPAPPDYTPIAAGQLESAQIAAQVSREQLAWAKEQYAQDRQVSDEVINRALTISESEAAAGRADRERYQQTFQPIQDDLVREYREYNTDAKKEQLAGEAVAANAAQFAAARAAAVRDLESYGVDPSQTRSGALDLGMRVAEAATGAGAANVARQQAEDQRRALRSEAINIGQGYGSQIAGAYGTALAANNQAVNAGLATTASGAGTMGTGVQWGGVAQGGYGGAAQTQNMGYQNALGRSQQQAAGSSSMWGGIGALAGAAIGTFIAPGVGTALGASLGGAAGSGLSKFEEGGVVTPDMSPSRGAAIDDVPILANEGEVVIPDDVATWYGEKFFHDLALKARKSKGDPQPRGLGPPGGMPASRQPAAIQMGA